MTTPIVDPVVVTDPPVVEPTLEEKAAAAGKAAAEAVLAAAATAKTEADKKAAVEAGEDEDALPEWARNKMKKANAEAAKYRTDLRAAQDLASKAKTPEEFEALRVELEGKAAAALKSAMVEKVARKHKLPDELAELLQGSTEEELAAHAVRLAKFVTAGGPVDLKGGLDPSGRIDNENDPRKLAARSKRR